jgi:hypothetical protein
MMCAIGGDIDDLQVPTGRVGALEGWGDESDGEPILRDERPGHPLLPRRACELERRWQRDRSSVHTSARVLDLDGRGGQLGSWWHHDRRRR